VVVGGEVPQDGLAGVVVWPDGGSEGQESLQDRGEDALGAVPAAACHCSGHRSAISSSLKPSQCPTRSAPKRSSTIG
jgi:hypothetical protein